MISYVDLHFTVKSFVMFSFFLNSALLIGSVPLIYGRINKLLLKIALPFLLVFNFALTVLLHSYTEFSSQGNSVPLLIEKLTELPARLYFFLIVLMAVFFIYLIVIEFISRKGNITVSSIKESIDNLPVGICYAKENGLVILSNRKIDYLSSAITGHIITDANRFWEEIADGDNTFKKYVFLSDGTVWSFKKTVLKIDKKTNIKITATDITDLHRLSTELAENNEKLININRRLKAYSENVDEVVRSRERLETKMRIHSDIGQVLLASRYALAKDDETAYKEVFDKWKFTIDVFKGAEKSRSFQNPWQRLFKVAEDIGVKIELRSSLPENKNANTLLCIAAAEALTNAVRHAQATELYVDITEKDGFVFAEFTNNGENPKAPIVLGGGLGSLKAKLSENGGSLEVGYGENGEIKITAGVKNND